MIRIPLHYIEQPFASLREEVCMTEIGHSSYELYLCAVKTPLYHVCRSPEISPGCKPAVEVFIPRSCRHIYDTGNIALHARRCDLPAATVRQHTVLTVACDTYRPAEIRSKGISGEQRLAGYT